MALEEVIHDSMGTLTASERKGAVALLADYPFAGLSTVAELAKRANVSVQTILRLTSKLGFGGYGDFQRTLIGEIKEGYRSPITLHETRDRTAPDNRPFLRELADASIEAVNETVAALSEREFETVCALIADRRRAVSLAGGRMSHTLADYLFRHLRQIRGRTYRVPENHEDWPEYLMRLGRRDVVLLFDYRRYQPDLEVFARCAARERNACVVLFTDKWLSPISKYATHIVPAAVDAGTPWDTGLSVLLILEAIINRVSEADWSTTRERIEEWDRLRNSAGMSPTPSTSREGNENG